MSNITRESLLQDGYHVAPVPSHKHADDFYQRRVREGAKTRYFINLFHYRHPDGRESWSGELHTYLQDGRYVDLDVHNCESVEDANQFFERAFVALGGRDYDEDGSPA